MKRVIIALACAAICLSPVAGWAGISGSDHDISGTTGEPVCQNCHVPHQANATLLWASTPSGTFSSVIQDLCWTCHDGTATDVGDSTAFNVNRQQHVGIAANGAVTPDCNGCHDVHNQNVNGTGKFLYTDIVVSGEGEYCTGCHGDQTGLNPEYNAGFGDHRYNIAGTTNHYTTTGFNCMGCHTPHGGIPQTVGAINNPILLDTMVVGGKYGDMCADCHGGTAPSWPPTGGTTAITAGGVAATDVFTGYVQTQVDGLETTHPTHGGSMPGCDACHDPHSAANDNFTMLLQVDNTEGAYCRDCHDQGVLGPFGAPDVGTSHRANEDVTTWTAYNDTTTSTGKPIPWALEINDDETGGADYPNAQADWITCETCHSVHRQGVGAPLLRELNTTNQLCGLCHPTNY